ncbi:MAG: hypothetical protein MJ225_04815 [Bacilli bacterium]|nr:hypothetical protein [Bacilli bacterium]
MIDKAYILNDIISVLSNHLNEKDNLIIFMSSGLYNFIAPNVSIKDYDKLFGINISTFDDDKLIWHLGTEVHKYE